MKRLVDIFLLLSLLSCGAFVIYGTAGFGADAKGPLYSKHKSADMNFTTGELKFAEGATCDEVRQSLWEELREAAGALADFRSKNAELSQQVAFAQGEAKASKEAKEAAEKKLDEHKAAAAAVPPPVDAGTKVPVVKPPAGEKKK